MVEPTIPEMIRVGLEFLQEMWETPAKRLRVNWPDDVEGQGLCISQLANLVVSPDCPWNVRAWAFDTLKARAVHYLIHNEPESIPTEMVHWTLRVVSGDVERPKRPRGRDREKNLLRDRTIANLVAWWRHYQGYTYDRAIELVASAVQSSGTEMSIETVRSVLKRDRDSGRPCPLGRVEAAFSRLSIPVEPIRNRPTP